MEGNRNMNMWAFIFLCIVGLHTCQVNGEVHSTQMFYAKLKIENSAIGNITNNLKPLAGNSSFIVDSIQRTTSCTPASANTNCICESGHKWSDNVCQNKKCCGNGMCTFPTDSAHMCISNASVSVDGSFTIKATQYKPCLKQKTTEEYKNCSGALLEEMKKVYSTLRGFDVFKITKYRPGSIVADFKMTFGFYVKTQDLIIKSETLITTLEASLQLNSTGVVNLKMPDNPVKYSAKHELLCTLKEDFKTIPVWQLNKLNSKVFDITNGTEATMTSETRTVRLSLANITEVWAGEYTCAYCQKSTFLEICHKASAMMDVALLPIIHMTTVPSFPHCQDTEDLVEVVGNCEIREINEIYNVKWSGRSTDTITPLSERPLYRATTYVSCKRSATKPQLKCTFHNRRSQTRDASVDINIIYADDKFCGAEGEWEVTKAGFMAVLKCKTVGQRRRKCNESAAWEEEEDMCVNKDVTNVLQRARRVDNGYGSLDGNTADVFSSLQNATNNTEAINTYYNVQASVDVLLVLGNKLNSINSNPAVDDLLHSSSNLMEPSLHKSWNRTFEDNLTLAEKYLSSVEKLIEASNISANIKKKNIEVDTCKREQGSGCNNTAFGVNVIFHSPNEAGLVKTTGIKQLGEYMPPKNIKDYELNSIIVLTTTEMKLSDSVKVTIDFKLLSERPRHVKIKCVFWDNTTKEWLEDGCTWEGPGGQGGRCICEHLSSFAILMAREPIKLSGMTEITVIGLSISVMSLVISIAIEFTVWSAVVKTNTLYLRHVTHINISLCLLVADCCFLASSERQNITDLWCRTFVVLKHFCYLSMFFWMLCLSSTLLHQAVFLFHSVSKKNYLRFSLILGYACPLFIVAFTILLSGGGAEGLYYHNDTCWLVYIGLFQGSIHSFLVPVGTIVFVNVFAMLVVIIKLLDQPNHSETLHEKQRIAAKTVVRTVIFLTPIFGVTWIFGFGVAILDLSSGYLAIVANYAFVLMNSFQGLFILLTTCLGDKKTREALLNCLKKKVPPSIGTISESSTKLET